MLYLLNGNFKILPDVKTFTAGIDGDNLEYLRLDSTGGDVHQLIATADGLRFSSKINEEWILHWNAALKSDLDNRIAADLLGYSTVNNNTVMVHNGKPIKNSDLGYYFIVARAQHPSDDYCIAIIRLTGNSSGATVTTVSSGQYGSIKFSESSGNLLYVTENPSKPTYISTFSVAMG